MAKRLELFDYTGTYLVCDCHFSLVQAVHAEGIKGDDLHILADKLLRDKKSRNIVS